MGLYLYNEKERKTTNFFLQGLAEYHIVNAEKLFLTTMFSDLHEDFLNLKNFIIETSQKKMFKKQITKNGKNIDLAYPVYQYQIPTGFEDINFSNQNQKIVVQDIYENLENAKKMIDLTNKLFVKVKSKGYNINQIRQKLKTTLPTHKRDDKNINKILDAFVAFISFQTIRIYNFDKDRNFSLFTNLQYINKILTDNFAIQEFNLNSFLKQPKQGFSLIIENYGRYTEKTGNQSILFFEKLSDLENHIRVSQIDKYMIFETTLNRGNLIQEKNMSKTEVYEEFKAIETQETLSEAFTSTKQKNNKLKI